MKIAKFTPIGVTLETIDSLIRSEQIDAMTLYMAYACIGQWQGTHRPKATKSFMQKRLKWGEERLRNAKKELVARGLISNYKEVDPVTMKVKAWYVEINHVVTETTPPRNPPPGSSHPVAVRGTSAFNERKVLSTKEKKAPEALPLEENITYEPAPPVPVTKTKARYLNERRADAGKPPMQAKPKTEKQEETVRALLVVDYYKQQAYEVHGLTFFSHPEDRKSIDSVNGQVRKQVIAFYKRCDEDVEKAHKVIDWFLDIHGAWCNYEPRNCFKPEVVTQYENDEILKKKKTAIPENSLPIVGQGEDPVEAFMRERKKKIV